MVTNVRLQGQYDERLLASVGLQGPYYNWNRWYLPSVGRYMELDPIAVGGGFDTPYGLDWYGYAMQDPVRWADPWGLTSCIYNVREHSMRCTTDAGALRFLFNGFRSGNDVFPGCRDNPATLQLAEGAGERLLAVSVQVVHHPDCGGRPCLTEAVEVRRYLEHAGIDATGPPVARARVGEGPAGDPLPEYDLVDPIPED